MERSTWEQGGADIGSSKMEWDLDGQKEPKKEGGGEDNYLFLGGSEDLCYLEQKLHVGNEVK